jgi:hypothetical protein
MTDNDCASFKNQIKHLKKTINELLIANGETFKTFSKKPVDNMPTENKGHVNIDSVTGKVILKYANVKNALHSKGKYRGKLKKGYRYVGKGKIIKSNNKSSLLNQSNKSPQTLDKNLDPTHRHKIDTSLSDEQFYDTFINIVSKYEKQSRSNKSRVEFYVNEFKFSGYLESKTKFILRFHLSDFEYISRPWVNYISLTSKESHNKRLSINPKVEKHKFKKMFINGFKGGCMVRR